MPNELKPPLGVSPYWFVYQKRITDLYEAMGRYIEHISSNNHLSTVNEYKLIANWAREIEILASLVAQLEERERANNG